MIYLWSFNLYFFLLSKVKEFVVGVVIGPENSVYEFFKRENSIG